MTHKKQKPGNKQSLAKYKRGGGKLHTSEYMITYDPIEDKDHVLPQSVRDRMNDIHDILRSKPKQAIKELLALKESYPDAPLIYNYLSVAYEATGNDKAKREAIIENYHKNPDYLFAKVNYAQICLIDGEAEKIPDIFGGYFDLKLLFPNRNCFHVTEFVGFNGVMCAYYAATGKLDTAKLFYKALVEVAPDSEMTRFPLRFMYPSVPGRLEKLMKLLRILKR